MFQDPTLDGYLTGEQNLKLHAELYGVQSQLVAPRMQQVMTMVGLWDRKDSPVATYSGGMRRRLEIARGLMHSPRVLFLDEPTIGLDPQTRRSIWTYIRELKQREEITIFMTTHYMDEAEWCDRIAIMDHGEIVALDAPETLKEQVGTDRVTIHTDDDQAAIAAIRERFGIEAKISEGAVTFGVPGGEEFVPRLFAELGIPIKAVSVSRPTLDDVFMSYTGTSIRDAEEDQSKARNRVMMQMMTRSQAMSTTTDRPDATVAPAAATEVVRVSVPKRSFASELRAIRIVWRRELIRFRADRLRMITSLVQPLLFLFVLGAGLQRLSSAGTHGVALKTFIYPGILCISVMFTAMFSAASIVWDREFGFLREMMVAPVRRSSIVIGKFLGGTTVAGFQGVIVICLAGLVHVPYDPLLILGIFTLQLLLAFAITAFGVMIAVRIKQMQSFMGVMQMIVMPMFFISGALVSGRRVAALARDPQPARPADLCGRSDAADGVQRSDDLARGPPRAGSGRHVVGLARTGGVRGRRDRRARPGDARDRDLGVQHYGIGPM